LARNKDNVFEWSDMSTHPKGYGFLPITLKKGGHLVISISRFPALESYDIANRDDKHPLAFKTKLLLNIPEITL